MGRPEKPVSVNGGVAAAFASELRRLRAGAGNPTYRDMARAALFSPSALSSAASGARLPSLQVTLGFVAACGGDRESWRRRWLEAAGETRKRNPPGIRYKRSPAHQQLPRPAQLPLRPRGFVGRRAELCRLGLDSTGATVISGPSGVGKTELALHHAHQMAQEMVDGQLYADLGPLTGTSSDAGYLLDGFLLALGVPGDHLPDTLDQRAGLYRSLLAERRLVVLLDNVRDERQVRLLLAETRRSVILVVSRTRLLGLRDVRRIRLDVLPRADSIAMITAAIPDRAAAAPQECDRLAELCGDLPLALDVALRKLVDRPHLGLHRVNAKLAESSDALEWLEIGDLSVRDSLDSVYRNLSDAAKTLVKCIARLPLTYDLGTLMQGEDDLVEELVEANMVRRSEDSATFRIMPLVRAYVVEVATSPLVDVPTQALAFDGNELGRRMRMVENAGAR
ncbi:ATP-binding protein [Amycolatopsis mongoliensis]|uniref:ATP-binding protein n=1 Tax=Amycolatopsis mongoliensis TaxID=715475 RepID=A0A9Y2NNC1_9PSEU|nr:ATP-binding protein [Amycolatopsis sp. 4-36]WIY05748.1 ATP-binding protein [Amycolatopsis sp. 4-36]